MTVPSDQSMCLSNG